jgi:hypothetical protein
LTTKQIELEQKEREEIASKKEEEKRAFEVG